MVSADHPGHPPVATGDGVSQKGTLLASISEFCHRSGMAESTFGRLAVNDGKFVSRLRGGARITPKTLERIRSFMTHHGAHARISPHELLPLIRASVVTPHALKQAAEGGRDRGFRFFDNWQKYLLFVNTCSEKQVIARRVGMELASIRPRPPAVRVFDAGMGDGTILTRVMRTMHRRFPTTPFYVVGKEISQEDVRLSLDKLPERLHEHPATVFVVTNMLYTEAPWLSPRSQSAATSLVWHEVALQGETADEFGEQIGALKPFLAKNWQVKYSQVSGNPAYDRPAVLLLYREDFRFLLSNVLPVQGKPNANFDLVIASHPYRARVAAEFKASKVIAPLARTLAKGGRLLGIQSYGHDPGMEIVRKVWPGEDPFQTSRYDVLRATRSELGADTRLFNFSPYADSRAIFRYQMHTLPTEISGDIGTSTLLAAWNAAVYVAQIDDGRLSRVMGERAYLDATRDILRQHGGLWFLDESYVVSRKRA